MTKHTHLACISVPTYVAEQINNDIANGISKANRNYCLFGKACLVTHVLVYITHVYITTVFISISHCVCSTVLQCNMEYSTHNAGSDSVLVMQQFPGCVLLQVYLNKR